MRRFLAIFLFLFITGNYLSAQVSYKLAIISVDNPSIMSKISYQKNFHSPSERDKEVKRFFNQLYDNAFLTAQADSIVKNSKDTLHETVVVKIGSQYLWANLNRGNVDKTVLHEINSPLLHKLTGKPFYYKEVQKLEEKIITFYENNGYPFAFIQLDSIQITDSTLSASLLLAKNNLVKVDSIVNRGKAKVSDAFLQSYLSVHNGDLYNESLMKKIGTRLKELPFVRENIPYRILFSEEKAKVELFLEKKRASQFDGILGLLPNSKTGKLLLTGDVHLKLNNSFNQGEQLELNWKSLQAGTQNLKIGFIFPYLFKSSFGADVSFKLYKKDSTYIEVNPNLGIQFHLGGVNYVKAFVDRRQMNLISTSHIFTLPPYADITSSIYGLAINLEELDYRLNPRKGYTLYATAGAGNKIIKKNDRLNPEVYKDLTLTSAQYNGQVLATLYIPLKQRSAFEFKSNSGYLKNATLFQNELFRLGGLKTIRGFDEESILASSYSILTFEYHFIFEENSYLFLFADGAYYENASVVFQGNRSDTPLGFGSGISFETKAGIFSISYALGRQLNNPIDFRSGKIHFGIINYF